MTSDQERWEQKYLERSHVAPGRPSPFLQEHLALLRTPRGIALDLACGEGRHALFLARAGWSVLALDVSLTALQRLRAAAEADPEVAASGGRITCVQADALTWPLATSSLSVVLCSRYLERDLAVRITEALAPGGILFFETFTRGQMAEPTGPNNPSHLLSEGELPRLFPALTVLVGREGRTPGGEWLSSLIAMSPSRK